ncbi:bifunctional 2-C-methyl-D-erythritol 4-phosphate cytidylyltransferase/2-C-methyl-D-erythritol 2,4-cyclodiphosphate synthase [Breoghania sp. L-A4]|uniref:bifunctional 2-C-methyl-D-erythritol 4-phosphate cytidylyltransferase/2-C-methyl-D-erythritol 2,4-cyclodiphosphate synthase n=1 Tax=Breoghania sp. L-A4 TaxID=2304600 RepID=UPI000E35B781|nr:bifunctional 2-C-methyl-D-erythritol 4-phosphate cytidylyltransferase/2-C-methyl-D-erythritol 2,4-cyclodiphosphate synthase [Breoghania sp. L-A4]AXS40656.1 bifunctional 2-C-methyl-D-erythritol 4-phosphate cytidylyltransferase/2-C-methyl-D-erythritol 2,4-cyclodiphosphate synthase [Breoghania sp. L-A4]
MPNNANTVPRGKGTVAIVVAAGRGSRMAADGDAGPKQYLPIGARPILALTLDALGASHRIDRIVTVIHADDRALYDAAIGDIEARNKLMAPVTGGATRQASVRLGLESLADAPPAYVLVHDGARPFIDTATIERVWNALDAGKPAVLAALPCTDTIKRVDDAGRVTNTLPRDGLWAAQTPQGFRFDVVLDAHRQAFERGETSFTDDAAVAEWAGHAITAVRGGEDNIKITTRSDLVAADECMRLQQWATLGDIRVGNGYDVHAFAPGDHVILGGVRIGHDRRLKGHSDADVALHAITDAIFGALADGDIGSHFPPSDPQWKGAASDIFLEHAVTRVARRGGRIAHIDLTIICEEPKIGPHRDAMRARIAAICGLPVQRIAVKATTSESLGFTGRREGIAAMATATVRLPLGDDDAGSDATA